MATSCVRTNGRARISTSASRATTGAAARFATTLQVPSPAVADKGLFNQTRGPVPAEVALVRAALVRVARDRAALVREVLAREVLVREASRLAALTMEDATITVDRTASRSCAAAHVALP